MYDQMFVCTLGKRLHVQMNVCMYPCSCVFVPASSVHEDSYANGGICYGMLTCVSMRAHICIHVQISAPRSSCVYGSMCVVGVFCRQEEPCRVSAVFWPELACLLRAG